MKVVIAGGSGLIGSALTIDLLTDQHQVVIISRNQNQTKAQFPQAEVIGWDPINLGREISGSDAVINLAGASIAGSTPFGMRWTTKRKADILKSRLEAGKALTEAVQSAREGPEVFIQASAIGYYGNNGTEFADESTPAGNDFLAEVCQLWEASTAMIEELDTRRVIIRIGLVFSPTGGIFHLLKLPFQFYLGGQIGDGEQYLSWISINDVVAVIRHLLDNRDTQGVFNLTSPNPMNNRDFAQLLGKIMGKPAWFPIPDFLLKITLGESATLALDGRQVLPNRLLDAGYQFQYKQLDQLLPELI